MWTWQFIPAGLLALLLVCYLLILGKTPKGRTSYKPYLLVTAIIIGIVVLALVLIYGS